MSNKYNNNNFNHRRNFIDAFGLMAINSYGEVFKLGSMVAFRKHGSDMLGYIDAFKHEDDCNVYAEIKNNLVKIDRKSSENMYYKDGKSILIIEEKDAIPSNDKYFFMKRYNMVFIHKNNRYISEFTEMLKQCTEECGVSFCNSYIYENK